MAGNYYIASGAIENTCTQSDDTGGAIKLPMGTYYCGIMKYGVGTLYLVAVSDTPFTLYCYDYNGRHLEYTFNSSNYKYYNINKQVVSSMNWNRPVPQPTMSYIQMEEGDTRSLEQVALDEIYGGISEKEVSIPVIWRSKYRAEPYRTSFKIKVRGHSNVS